MNKNSIIGFFLIAAIMIGYTLWMTPSAEELAKKQHTADSALRVQKQRQLETARLTEDREKQEEQAQISTATDDSFGSENINSDNYSDLKQKFDVFANSADGTETSTIIENDLARIEISNKGGHIKSVQLKDFQTSDSLPLILFNPETSNLGFTFFSNNRIINTSDFYFQASSPGDLINVNTNDSFQFSMRLYTDKSEGVFDKDTYIEYLYTIKGNDYMIDFDVNFVNMGPIVKANALGLNWNADLRLQEQNIDNFNGSTIYYKFFKEDVDYLSETKDDEEVISTKVKWVSFKQRFFNSTIIAKDGFENANMAVVTKENTNMDKYLKSMDVELGVPFNIQGNTNVALQFYFGPNDFYKLKSYDLDLEDLIPIGWGIFGWINKFIVLPVFSWLGGYGWNYGIVILVLTLMLKFVLFPIAYKTYMSSAKMRVLKPEVDELAKKFPKKEDAMKKQQATMSLYKKAGANPASGCVPMLLQMPILIAMFRFFPASIELRQKSFLWATDLSSYDSIYTLPFDIPYYGDHVSLFTLLMTVSTLMYTYLNNQMMGSQTQQMPGMKTMMYLMPLMFLGLFNNYASGLSYYYFLANVITFSQMFAFRYLINEDKLRAKIEANKKKPQKPKSNFQKRLEEAAKQKGYNAKR
jgi:YidC/Oxa1 family membrane protein insertase